MEFGKDFSSLIVDLFLILSSHYSFIKFSDFIQLYINVQSVHYFDLLQGRIHVPAELITCSLLYRGEQKRITIPKLQQILGSVQLPKEKPLQHRICPICKKGNLVTLCEFTA